MVSEQLVSIIIVNYNGIQFLPKCIDSIISNCYKNYEIILVDNNSTDNSIEYVKEKFPHVKIIKLDKNYGYAEPSNIGAKEAKGDFLYFLNNDTILHVDSMQELVRAIKDPDIAIGQSLLLKPDETVDSAGDFITTMGIAYRSHNKPSSLKPILSARGASMIIKRKVFWDLGGFDKKFFASFEDVDLGWRAWIYGYKVVLVPNSIVYHLGGKTVKMFDDEIKYHGVKNTLIICLANFELTQSIKSLFFLAGMLFTKKSIVSKSNSTSEIIIKLPSIEIVLKSLGWVLRNLKYISRKRKLTNSRRVRSTGELIKMGLITKGKPWQ